jgi:UDP-N-acetylglucosamine acyltransferase
MAYGATRIHPHAVVSPRASLGQGVVVGPFCTVGEGAVLGDGCELVSHVVVADEVRLGEACQIFPFAALGMAPQVRDAARTSPPTQSAFPRGRLVIGARNVIREHVTLHPGTVGDTRLGDDNLLMAGCHVAHDVVLGARNTIANAVQLAGHVQVGDFVTFGGLAGVAQRVRIGDVAFVAAGAMVERDVPPYVIAQGDRARVRVLNKVGLVRAGFSSEECLELGRVFREVWVGKRELDAALPWSPRARAWAEALRPVRAAARQDDGA